jgi:hypothetical protein
MTGPSLDEQLILRTEMKPIRAKKIRWWQELEFVDRQSPTPAIPTLEVLIAMDDGGAFVTATPSSASSGHQPNLECAVNRHHFDIRDAISTAQCQIWMCSFTGS